MIALSQIGTVQTLLGCSLLSKSPLWDQPLDKVIPEQLLAFKMRYAHTELAEQADNEVKCLINFLKDANCAVPGVDRCPLVGFTLATRVVMTATELIEGLQKMTCEQRQAVLFGLETGYMPEILATLTWENVQGLELSGLANNILRSRPRSIATNLVFWEAANAKAPLLNLRHCIFDAFGLLWPELRTAYQTLLWVDSPSELRRWQNLLMLVL